MSLSKIKCDCGKIAVWIYMPGYSSGSNPYLCDDCIMSDDNKLGCTCNWEHFPTDKHEYGLEPEGVENIDWMRVINPIEGYLPIITIEDGYWQQIDGRGRPYPCAEYEYSEDGFDELTIREKILDFVYGVKYSFRDLKRRYKQRFKRWWSEHICAEIPKN